MTGARQSRDRWKKGECPSCGARMLTVAWGRDRDRTMVKCRAETPCPQGEILAEFSKRGLSLVMQTGDAPRRKARRTTSEMDPIERALSCCTLAELRLYQWLRERGDGPAKVRDMPDGKHRNAGRAIPVLEHLGLVRVKRGRFDPYGGRQEANVYEVARVKPFHPIPSEDSLKAIRKTLKQNINDGPYANYTCIMRPLVVKVTTIRTCPRTHTSDEPAPRRSMSRAELSRCRTAARHAGAVVFCKLVGGMVLARPDRAWRGTWGCLLAAVPRPGGARAWPASKMGVMDRLWLGREVLRDLGLQCEWVRRQGMFTGRLSAVAITIKASPMAPSEAEIEAAPSAAKMWSSL